MDYRKAQEAYLNDPQYHQLIDLLVHQIETLEMTPSEIRQAAIFACIKHEQINVKPFYIEEHNRLKEILKNYGSCPQRLKGKP